MIPRTIPAQGAWIFPSWAFSSAPTLFCAAACALWLALGADDASAQGVDRYQFLQMQKQVKDLTAEVETLRNAVRGGDAVRRLDALEDEISRLTGQLERLEFAQRQHESEAKRRLDDLEYRVIELEGGDPSVLFQEDQGGLDKPLLAPAPPTDQTLGVIRTARSTDDGGDFDAGVAAVEAGRGDGAAILRRFLDQAPDSPLAGDAYFWIGESHFREGAYQQAANHFLDGATRYPEASKSPESLLKLGVALSLLGKRKVACATLREVGQRYPDAVETVAQAETEARRTGCG